jgi:cytochrome c551
MNVLNKWSMILATLILTIGLVAACGGNDEQTTPTDDAPAEGTTENETPADQPDEEGTEGESDDGTAGDADIMATGEAVVNQACISCHGANLEGGIGPALQNIGNKYNKEEIISILINGKGSMPGNLAKDNEEAVAIYLLSLQ